MLRDKAASSYWMHRIETTSLEGGDEASQSSSKKTPAFLCALAAAKFVRRGVFFERVQLAARQEREGAAAGNEAAESSEQDGMPRPRKLKQ